MLRGRLVTKLRHGVLAGRVGQFLDAVALGQITPGPVVQTVAAVGYAAAGLTGPRSHSLRVAP
jgi:hypothetical protein